MRPDNLGGSLRGMRNNTRIGCRVDIGGSPSANSIAVMPIDQMSERASYLVDGRGEGVVAVV